MTAASAKKGIYLSSTWERVLAMNIIGIGMWMYRNHRREYLFDFALAYPNGRFINRVKADKIRMIYNLLCKSIVVIIIMFERKDYQ